MGWWGGGAKSLDDKDSPDVMAALLDTPTTTTIPR